MFVIKSHFIFIQRFAVNKTPSLGIFLAFCSLKRMNNMLFMQLLFNSNVSPIKKMKLLIRCSVFQCLFFCSQQAHSLQHLLYIFFLGGGGPRATRPKFASEKKFFVIFVFALSTYSTVCILLSLSKHHSVLLQVGEGVVVMLYGKYESFL